MLYNRTRFGFEVQVLSDSERAARYGGVRVRRTILAVMAISGAIAGLGGAAQVGNVAHGLDGDPNGLQKLGYGYTGIVVAALARYNPFAVCLVAFLIGGLENAGNTLQGADFPAGLVGVIQGIILFCALGGEVLVRYRLRVVREDKTAAPTAEVETAVMLFATGVNHSLLVVVIASGVAYGTPLLYASLGELLAERSGVLNLGVEGMMLVGAVMGFWCVQRFHVGSGVSLAAGLVVAAIAGALMASIHAFLVITLRASQIVSGLALTIFAGAVGLSSYLGNDLNIADQPGQPHVQPGLPVRHADAAGRRADHLRPGHPRLHLVGARARADLVPEPHAARPQRARRRRVARRRRRDGDQCRRLPLRPHDRRRRARRDRRGDLHPRDHAPVGERDHRRRRLDRDRARHLRLLAARALPRRRVLLRRAPGARARAAGAADQPRPDGALDELAAVHRDDRRARRDLAGERTRRRLGAPAALGQPYTREER